MAEKKIETVKIVQTKKTKTKLVIDFTNVVAHFQQYKTFFEFYRTPHGILGCKGTDANRNWGFHWNDGGSSSNSCSETYMGPEVWSEVENT